MEKKSKKTLLILGLIAIAAIIIAVAVSKNNQPSSTKSNPEANQVSTETPAANIAYDKDMAPAPVAAGSSTVLKDAVIAVPGTSPITKDNQVVTEEGKPVDTSARIMSPEAPHQSGLLDKANLDISVMKLMVTANGFSPSQFTTKAGEPTTFSLTSGDSSVHVIAFDDPALSAISILVGPGQTRAITFPAPSKAGEYSFHCESPLHADRGEKGKMIVK